MAAAPAAAATGGAGMETAEPEELPVTFINREGFKLVGTFTRVDPSAGAACVILQHG
jgi:hypothetical protein